MKLKYLALIGVMLANSVSFADTCSNETDIVSLTGGGFYQVGETVSLQLSETIDVHHFQQVDLYIIIELPGGDFLYMTDDPFNQFSPTMVPFLASLQHSEEIYQVLDFDVPPGMGGDYIFYAFFNQEGEDLGVLFKTLSSNVAKATVTLANR